MTQLLVLLFLAAGPDHHVQLTPDTTKVEWTLGDVLHTVHGTFKLKSGDIHFDAQSGKVTGEVVVDARSGNSGSGARDGKMHKSVVESDKYPDITFAPDQIEGSLDMKGTSNVKLHGSFKIHGSAHELIVPAQVTVKDGMFNAILKFDIPYVAWGMKDPSTLILKVNKSVQIEVRTSAKLGGD